MVYDSGQADSAPAWSPGGTQLAFERHGPVGGVDGDFVLDLATGGDANLTFDPLEMPVHDEGPAWSPDGTRIPFSAARASPTIGMTGRRCERSSSRPRSRDPRSAVEPGCCGCVAKVVGADRHPHGLARSEAAGAPSPARVHEARSSAAARRHWCCGEEGEGETGDEGYPSSEHGRMLRPIVGHASDRVIDARWGRRRSVPVAMS